MPSPEHLSAVGFVVSGFAYYLKAPLAVHYDPLQIKVCGASMRTLLVKNARSKLFTSRKL